MSKSCVTQQTFYPCDETKESLCITCNAGLSSGSGTDGNDGTPGASGAIRCSAYCNASCNVRFCETVQSYAKILENGLISSHKDIGAYPMIAVCGPSSGETVATNYTIIQDVWTKNNWNSLIAKLNLAATLGKLAEQGGTNVTTLSNDDKSIIITKKHYDAIVDKIHTFNHRKDLAKPEVNALITATLANALKEGFESAKFNSTVCDVCNAGAQSDKKCVCNCPICTSCPSCSCSCPCACSCPACSSPSRS